MQATVTNNGFAGAAPALGAIKVYGLAEDPKQVTMGDKEVSYTFADGVLTVDMSAAGLTAADSFELQFGSGAMASPAGWCS